MKPQPSKYFYELVEQYGEWKFCVEVIKHYIQFLDVPEGLFTNEETIPAIDRFQYFTEALNSGFDNRFRRRNCHVELFETLQKYGVQDEEVLWWYIWEFLGYRIPRVTVCELHNPDHDKFDYPHCAPFDYVKDMFFETVKDSIAFANRTGGKTSNVAVLNHLDMTFKDGCEVASAGATLDQAAKVYRYFTMFHKHPVLQSLLLKPPTKSMTIYNNDSLQEVVTGSVKGLNSPHPQKARIDEVELIEWDVLQEGFSMSMSKGKIQGQITMLCVTKDTILWPFDPLLYLDIEKRMGPLNNENYLDHRNYTVEDLLLLYSDSNRDHDALLMVFDEKTHFWTSDRVKRVWKTKRDKIYRIKYKIIFNNKEYYIDTQKATIDHMILLSDFTWKEIGKLRIGERIYFGGYWKEPDYAEFIDIEYVGIEDVYDIEMENHHNFIADCGIVLHNSTRKYDTGSFNRLLEESESRGIKVYCWCLGGETIVRSPSGDSRIRDLVGKEIYVYSVKNNELVLRKAKNIRKTRKQSEVIKISYEWWAGAKGRLKKGSIIVTPDHLMLLTSGDYKMAMNLKIGDSLMPFYKEFNEFTNSFDHFFAVGFTGSKSTRESRFVWEQLNGPIPKGFIIHHKDGNDFNNDPDNLECVLRKEHSKKHTIKWWENTDIKKIEERNNKISEKAKNFAGSHERALKANMIRWHGNNHKVTSIESYGHQDVYCMEVEDTHNFAAQDVFVHNCIFEVLEKCTRLCEADPKYGDCPIWDKCKGIAHNCNGFYQLDDWIGKARLLSKETLDTQWFNKKPSRDILVYGDSWQEEIHYREMNELEISPDCMIMSGIDFGSSPGHDFVYQKAWVDYSDLFRAMEELEPGKELFYKLKFFVFYEYRTSKGTLAYHAAKIKDSPEYREGEIIFADPSAKQARIDLSETYKIDTYMAVNEVVDGIDNVRHHLEVYKDYADGGKEKSNYYIIKGYLDKVEEQGRDPESNMYRLLGTHEEFDRYKYPKQQDGKVVRKIPVPINDHGLDCTRYIVHTSYKIIMDLVVPVEDDIDGGYWGNAREESL